MKNIFVLHYDEITLKGGSRHYFEQIFLDNIKRALKGLDVEQIRKLESRVIIEAPDKIAQSVKERLGKIFGLRSFALGVKTGREISEMGKAALGFLREKKIKTFRIESSRADKQYPLTSMEIDREVGAYVFGRISNLKAKMKNPNLTIYIEVLRDSALVYGDTFRGPGGLPCGSGGRTLALLSGGIDSPVAAWRMMKRGLDVNFIHFHSYPFTDKISMEKVKDLAKILNGWQRRGTLYLLPLANIQKEIVAKCSARLRVLLYRRMMIRIAEKIARQNKMGALVTGESVGQVASQTLPNIAVINEAAALPILRPLIGYDKEEIVAEAKRIGTYDISIQPHGDCCSLFLPPHPATKARLSDILEEEKKLNIKDVLTQILTKIEIFKPI